MTIAIGRRNSVPIIYTRGSNYEVGFDVGRTFKCLIQDYLEICDVLNNEYIPTYETLQGKKVYTETLKSVQENYPHYVKELEGTADGAEVPFYKLFLLHMDQMVTISSDDNRRTNGTTHGCSTVCCNQQDQEILGHTEDSLADMLGYFYFVSAHVIYDKPHGRLNVTEEKFTSLCYPGHLPGFTMNYNQHGFVYSINVIHARDLYSGKTPGFFLCRGLLAAENYSQAEEVLKDRGCGSAEGFSVNMTFLNSSGDRVFYNVEVGAAFPGTKESLLHTSTIRKGECNFHCNRYMRLKIPEKGGLIIESSQVREKIYDELTPPKNKQQVINLLSHQSEDNFTIYRDYKENDVNTREPIATLAVGIFDCIERSWTIYTDNPARSSPIAVLPIITKKSCFKDGRCSETD